MHPGGVNILMLDGSTHFVSDFVDLSVWHAIHSRKTSETISLDALEVEVDKEAKAASNSAGRMSVTSIRLIASCVGAAAATCKTFRKLHRDEVCQNPRRRVHHGAAGHRKTGGLSRATPAHLVTLRSHSVWACMR